MKRVSRIAAHVASMFALATPALSANDSPDSIVAAHDPRIAIMGRVAFTEEGSARMGFPGSVIRFVYRGSAPVLRFTANSDDCFFNIACNGWDPAAIRLAKGSNEITVPSGAAPETGYVVELTRRTEAWQGVATFQGLGLPTGCELLEPPAWPARKLLFIGDSMTCGQYADRLPPENDTTARSSNAARSFGMILGRMLDAQVHLVSYGGRGVMRDWEGKTDTGTAPQFFERTLPDEADAHWDHASYQPDAVAICLGQNDLNQGLPDKTEFLRIYEQFVVRIREVYPKTAIILAESAMQGEEPGSEDGKRREFLRSTIEAIVAHRRSAGDTKVAFAPVHKAPGTIHDSHPVAFQHEHIAQQLFDPIRQLTGW